ncbi:peptidoglycan D,D-transpeptidase FtsI family protein [Facklamia miroungae]|uniref:Penicillin-binding protein 2B n=1 Tax=Facklamia miroungae TaxID=120956 RepID=A0A1G7TV34_9LACT|nr:penicillin-binding protein 2 [Facklamia miroungae]NKZ29965.1 penicillin-binding protein 2 [Facklamia miroungae]SDG38599.1 penicillin-binding protein 2B [Facklamia miroungae]
MKNNNQVESNQGYNLFFLSIVVICTGLILIGRMTQIGLFKQVNGVNLMDQKIQTDNGSSIAKAKRGTIYDQFGQPIAMDTTSYSMYAVLNADWADGETVKDIDYTASILSKYIDLPRETIWTLLNKKDVNQIEFGSASKNLSAQTKLAIEAENLPGIFFTGQVSRYYFNDYFASHLVGYAENINSSDASNSILEGAMGVEAAYNDVLSGEREKEGSAKTGKDLLGSDIYLTLDSRIQNQTETVLDKTFKKYSPESMGAYLVDLESGKLLTSAQRPSFNLNTREGIDDLWQNLLVETANEPGSTIKILTMAKAKEKGVFQPGETFLSGKVNVYDREVRDHNQYGWGQISFEDGFIRSSNVAMVDLVNRMGDQVWVEELKKFGFGVSTNSRLANENPGSLDFTYPISRIMSGFGQAFSATPIQLMQAYSSIANHGEMMKIQYIDHIAGSQNGYQKQSLGQVVDPQVTPYILDLMVRAVEDPEGTSRPFKSDLVKVAAKTGTAEIGSAEGLGYLTGRNNYFYSVISFFPAEKPKYMLYLFIKRPQNDHGIYGTQMLSEVFHPMLESILINQ